MIYAGRIGGSSRTGFDGVDDIFIAGTAAQIAVQLTADGGFARAGVLAENINPAHDHAGRAKSTLQGMMFVKRFL